MKKGIAEFIGTFTLVFFGCGAAVIGGMGSGPTAINVLGIAFAFGLSIVAMAYGIGPALIGMANNPGAVGQLWLFIIAPLLGAGAAGLLFANGVLAAAKGEAA